MLAAVGGSSIGAIVGGLLAQRFGLTAPFWFGFFGSALMLALIWRSLDAIAHAPVAEAEAEAAEAAAEAAAAAAAASVGARDATTYGPAHQPCPAIESICDDRDTMDEELRPSEVARRLGTSTRTRPALDRERITASTTRWWPMACRV